MPAVILLISVGDQDPRWFASSQDGHDFIGLGTPEIGVHEVVTTAFWRLQDRRVPLMGTVRHPVLVLVGDFVEKIACHPFSLAVGVEEADDAFGLLKRLDRAGCLLVYRRFPQTGDLWVVATNASGGGVHSCQYRRRVPPPRQSRQSALHEHRRRIA